MTKINGNQGFATAAWGMGEQGLSVKDAELVKTTAAELAPTTAATSNTSAMFDPAVFQPGRSIMDIFNLAVGGYSTPSTPSPTDSGHTGGLQTGSNGVITTPGGYKIEATNQFEWKVTGPDGKTTRVWGDPHVDEGDGGKWDFKKDSTFVLGDGTRINVSTTPYGNGMTVTKGLEIISGNDRLQISDIDKGKGKVGTVTQDGYAHANSFGGKDVFVMGKESDDWSYQGKEVIGSNNGGDSFKLGNDLPVGSPQAKPSPFQDKLGQLFQQMSRLFDQMSKLSQQLEKHNPFEQHRNAPGRNGGFVDRRHAHLKTSFEDIGRMLDAAAALKDLRSSVQHRYLMA